MAEQELILKLPVNKPPFIGILFENQFEAARLNQGKVNSYKENYYKIILEPTGEVLDLSLCLAAYNFIHTYKVKYDAEKLYKFLYQTKSAKQFNFGHVIIEKDKHKIVRTSVNSAPYVLKVYEVKVVGEH